MASEDAVVAQCLECCLCFELFTEPKQLSCTHSFCKKCLNCFYDYHSQQNELSCPMCHEVTIINNGDISKLQTNVPICFMVEDMKSAKRSCTVCDPDSKSRAVQYCMQCDEYMCDPCAMAHGNWKKNTKHDVVSVDDVMRGKVKVKRFCNKHEEEKLYVCTSCNVSICFRCHVLDHSKDDHVVKEVSDFKKTIQNRIKFLQDKATTKMAMIEARTRLVTQQTAIVEVELDQRMAEIYQTYEGAVQLLTMQRNDLVDQCKQEKETLISQLQKIKEADDKRMACIRSASELVGNGVKTLLEGQSFVVHSRVCDDLQNILDERDLDAMQPESIGDQAKGLKFVQGRVPDNLGNLQRKQNYRKLEEVSTFPLSHARPWDAVPLPDGRVAVGYLGGRAIEMFTVDGPQATVLRGVSAFRLSVLSDGRFVVRDGDNNITLYTEAWERLHVKFNTPSQNAGGWGGMCVDRDDNIYVGYRWKKHIDVFRPEDGNRLREIPCHDHEPGEICHMNQSKRLVVCDGSRSIRVVGDKDGTGTVQHRVEVDSTDTRIAVLKDDCVLIGCMNSLGDRLRIELYKEDLTRLGIVFSDNAIGLWALRKLVELPSGEVVGVSSENLIVFRKIFN